MFWPCETRTSTCRSFATISSGLYRFLAIAVLLDVKDIPQVGPLQWGWITVFDPVSEALIVVSDPQQHLFGVRILLFTRQNARLFCTGAPVLGITKQELAGHARSHL